MKITATIDIVDEDEKSRGASCRIPMHVDNTTTMQQFHKLIGIASEDLDQAEWIKFKDDDGDWVTIKTDDDVTELFQCAKDQDKKINVRIHGPEDVANLEQLVAKAKKKKGKNRGNKAPAFLVNHNNGFNNNNHNKKTKLQNTKDWTVANHANKFEKTNWTKNVTNNNSNYNESRDQKQVKKLRKQQKKRMEAVEQRLLPTMLDTFENGLHEGISMLTASATSGIQTTLEEIQNANPKLKSGDTLLSEYESELLVQTVLQVLNQEMPYVIQNIEHSVRQSMFEFQNKDDGPIGTSETQKQNSNGDFVLLDSVDLVNAQFENELNDLIQLGFTDMDTNRSLLVQHQGNMEKVVDKLVALRAEHSQ